MAVRSSLSPSHRRTAPHAGARRAPGTLKRSRPVPSKTRILIGDDQIIDRTGLIALLRTQRDFEVVGEASAAEEAVRLCREIKPSVVVLALRLPAPDGRTAVSVVHTAVPDFPILAIAERGEMRCLVLNPSRPERLTVPEGGRCESGIDCLQLAVAEGASGTIRRSASPDDLFRSIRTVASGLVWYEARTAASIMSHALAGREPGRPILTHRETEIAGLIADGRSNKEISQTLRISQPTVKKHIGHVLQKLNLQDRLQLGLHVARNPLILRRVDPARR